MTHTPGPWKWDPELSPEWNYAYDSLQSNDGQTILDGLQHLDGGVSVDYLDARLIQAAPDLLEALKSIVELWDEHVPTVHITDLHLKARAAVEKATGAKK